MERGKKNSSTTFVPIFIGLLIIKGFLYIYKHNYLNFHKNWAFAVIIAIVIRLLIGFWTISLTNKYKIKQTLWVFLGFIFGSFQLIAINVAIWIKGKR